MAVTGFDRFVELARDHTIVPVWEELLADTLTPVGAFRAVVGDGPGFLLESAEHGERWSRFSFLGRSPVATLSARGRELTVVEGAVAPSVPLDAGVLACLEGLLDAYRSPALAELPPLHCGLVGYLGYDVVREIERLGAPPTDDLGLPDAVVSVVGELVAFDHWRSRVVLVDNVVLDPDGTASTPGAPAERDRATLRQRYELALERLAALRRDLQRPVAEPLTAPPERAERLEDASVRRVLSSRGYQDAVEAAKEYIRAGDAFQIVLSQRAERPTSATALEIYRALRRINPSPYLFLLELDGVSLVGSSPETLVKLEGSCASVNPIAGSTTPGEGDAERLLASEKDRAEHVMLVDLGRNDLSRVCVPGTVEVKRFLEAERFSHITHLVSEVVGELAPGVSPFDLLRVTFPAGTVSGAPKVRAMQIISELEQYRRGSYAGAVLYSLPGGPLDACIAIRTIVLHDGVALLQAGAGIVADSDPRAEHAECLRKLAALETAIDLAEAGR